MKNEHQWLVKAAIMVSLLLAGVLVLTLVNPHLPVAGAQTRVSSAQYSSSPGVQAETSLPRTITVVGEGKVRLKPDIAQINIGVEVVGDTVKETSSDAAATMNAVMAALMEQGVAENDMQTSGYNVWVERPYSPEGTPTDNTLYHVGNNVTVTIRNLDTVGAVLDAAIEAGANNIYGVTFSVADPSPLMSEARQEAVADALSKAQELAQLNNVAVGDVVEISEVIAPAGFYAGSFRGLPAAEGLGGGGGPISPGELEMTVQLQITYAIQ